MQKNVAICGNVRKFAPKNQMRRQMKRYFRLLCMALATVMLCVSCLNDDDSNVTEDYRETAITSFYLGTLDQNLHTTSSTGTDSVYKKTIDCSSYKFHIDQLQRRIFNTDSLPVGTDVTRAVCTIATYKKGVIWLAGATEDDMKLYSSSDSIDFSQPVKMRVYAYGSSEYSTYTVSVNVHQQEGDEFNWEQMSAMTETAQQAYLNTRTGQETSEGGRLIGRCSTELYALTTDNWLRVSKDGGLTWDYDELGDDASLLPTDDLAYVSYPYSSYSDMDYVLIGGSRSSASYPDDNHTFLWYKVVDHSVMENATRWSFIEVADNNYLYLPRLTGLSLFRYDGRTFAVGLNGTTLMIYETKDGGITWKESSDVSLPAQLESGSAVVAFVDADNYIWVLQTSTGQLWRGRHNRLGWK